VKSLMFPLQDVLEELGTWCRISTLRDLKTITMRVESEGLSFLTITLPTFASDFQKSLDEGQVGSQLFQGFRRGRGGLPLFLGGFLGLVFDREGGRLLDDPSIDAIHAIRQITLLFSKVLLPCTQVREQKAIDKFVECEQDLRESDASRSIDENRDFLRMSNLLWSPVLQEVDEVIFYGQIVPKHGPGSTAEKLLGNKKYLQHEWTERLEGPFPHGEFLFPNLRYYSSNLNRTKVLEPGQERPVRVVTVPKTLKTPRVIAIEPTCMQYVQQGIMEQLVERIERFDTVRLFVGFTDRLPNQELAKKGSSTGSLATLDLSEASDRVSNQLVRIMTTNFPHFAEAVDSCRSRKADVPGYGVKRLAKFASMGSALTFPVESMVFTTLVFLGIERALNRRLTLKDIKSFKGQVRIYGDDIIVPVDYVHSVVGLLETFGFQVNANKSFWTGKFRESCGKEYYDGHDVSIVKLRRSIPTRRTAAREIISLVSFRNQLYYAGLWGTCKTLDEYLRRLIPFPVVLETSPVLGRHSFLGFETQKVCARLHRPLVKGFVKRAVIPASDLRDDAALLKVFLKRGDEPFADRKHLERAGRPDAVDIKLGWASAV